MKNLKNYFFGECIGRKYKSSTQKHTPNFIILGVVIVAQIMVGCNKDDDPTAEPWMAEIEQLKAAIKPYHDINP